MRGKLLLLSILCFFPVSTFATFCNSMMSIPCGWYVEGNVGYTHVSGDFGGARAKHDKGSGGGGNVNLGYKLMPYLATEVGYTQFPSSSIKVGSVKVATIKHYAADIAVKGILPVEDTGFEAFAKLGAGFFRSTVDIKKSRRVLANTARVNSSSRSKGGLFFGLGGQYYFMPEFAVVLQWQRFQGSSSSGTADLYSIGLSLLFV